MLRTGKKKRSNGFLLIEIMVSMSILSVGILFILNSFMRSLYAIEISGDYFKAGLLAEEKLFELYNSRPQEGLSEGAFKDFNNKFSWNLETGKAGEDLLNDASLKIQWEQRSKKQEFSVCTYLKAGY